MGYDDREIAQHLHPPLSSAAASFRDGLGSGGDPHRRRGGFCGQTRQIKVECPIVRRKSV
jgi:LacI family transcriptional regulator